MLLRGDPTGPLAHPDLAEALAGAGSGAGDPVAALVDGFSVHEELRSVLHDPLVREPVAGAGLVVLAPGRAGRMSAWDREQLGSLIDAVAAHGPLLLVDDHGPWSAGLRAVAATRDVKVASGTPGAIASAVHDHLAGGAPSAPVPSRSVLVTGGIRRSAPDDRGGGGDQEPPAAGAAASYGTGTGPGTATGEEARGDSERALRILVRGDSQATYVGRRLAEPHDPRLWAGVLVDVLTERGHLVEVRNASPPGLMIAEGLAGFRHDPAVREAIDWADVVVFALSINDFWPVARPQAVADWMDRARPLPLRRAVNSAYRRLRPRMLQWTRGRIRPTPPDRARADYATLVREVQATGRQVALVTPLPVRSPVNPLLDGNTEEAAEAVCAVAAEAGVAVVDCRELFPPASWEKISADHLHADEGGHRLVAVTLADALDAAGALVRQPKAIPPAEADGRVLLRGDRRGFLSDPAVAVALGPGRARPLLVPGFSVHSEVRWIPLDPLVRDAYDASSAAVIAPGRTTRPTAWDREQMGTLFDLVVARTRLVVVDDGGPWSPAIKAAAEGRDVTVVPADATALARAVAPTS